MRLSFATTLLWLLAVCQVDAQAGGPWAVVPTRPATAIGTLEPTARAVRDELWNRGIEVWALERAVARFEARESTPPAQLDEREIGEWKAYSKAAMLPLASGDYAESMRLLSRAQELSRRAPEQLNREPGGARQVLDTCLFMVRALQQAGSESLARGLARECRELVLEGEPNERMHPPEVLAVLSNVDRARAEQTGSILVRSEPSDCGVRVNGVLLGETPYEIRELFPGRYRVQVECEEGVPSRVHELSVGFGRVDVLIDVRFDESVTTRPLLELRYPDEDSLSAYRLADALRIARTLPAGPVLLVREVQPGITELELFRGDPLEQAALVRVSSGPDGLAPRDLASATRALIDGDCRDFSDSELPPISCEQTQPLVEKGPGLTKEQLREARRMPRGQRVAGVTLASVGSAALTTGYLLLLPRKNTAEEWIDAFASPNPETRPAQQKWLNLGSGIVYTAAGGAAALVAAMPLALPRHEKPPWWAWLSGGIGVGLAAFSIAYGINAEPEPDGGCNDGAITQTDAQTCLRRGEDVAFSVLAGLTAAPALTVPLVYLFRRSDTKVEPSVQVGAARGYVGVRGRF
ncbi:MAG: PEGA domain-containing protein [Deltaproteobacteria bacterium]|jgi:hypothetical protein|nr:PEGA domain-containing protein [Deltaproteobacteria bacterium]